MTPAGTAGEDWHYAGRNVARCIVDSAAKADDGTNIDAPMLAVHKESGISMPSKVSDRHGISTEPD